MNKKIIGVISILTILLVSSMSAVTSAKTINITQKAEAALATWEVDGVTISADFYQFLTNLASQGKPYSTGFLELTVYHPFGKTESTVTKFDWSWSADHASASASMPFTVIDTTKNEPVTIYHDITITWDANSKTTTQHVHTNFAIVNMGIKTATATLTISTPDNPVLTNLHSGTYYTENAAILKGVLTGSLS